MKSLNQSNGPNGGGSEYSAEEWAQLEEYMNNNNNNFDDQQPKAGDFSDFAKSRLLAVLNGK